MNNRQDAKDARKAETAVVALSILRSRAATHRCVFACVAALVLAGCNSASTSPRFDFSAESIERVDVAFRSPPAAYSSSDSATLRNILDMLSAASQHPDHKCVAVGTLSLRLQSGRDVQLKLLPGHEPTTYEFRFQDSLYRVPRARFSEVLRAIGVTQLPE